MTKIVVYFQDPRFDDEVDRITGYHTESLLCMAVKNAYDEIIAVAQVVNKNPDKDDGHFTTKDEKVTSIVTFYKLLYIRNDTNCRVTFSVYLINNACALV